VAVSCHLVAKEIGHHYNFRSKMQKAMRAKTLVALNYRYIGLYPPEKSRVLYEERNYTLRLVAARAVANDPSPGFFSQPENELGGTGFAV